MEKRPALPALTGARILAAVLVVCCHFATPSLAAGPLRTAFARGTVGVDFFFILSGFILVYTYSAVGPRGGLRGTRRAFYVARAARILPVYLVGLGLGLGPLLWLSEPAFMHPNLAAILLTTATLTQAWFPYWHYLWDGPAWSLAAEAFFYALFPATLGLLSRCRISGACLVLIGSYAAILSGPWLYLRLLPDAGSSAPIGYWWEVVSYNPVVRLPEFIFGMALGRLFLQVRAQRLPPLVPALGSLLALALIAFLLSDGAWTADPLYVGNGMLAPLFGVLILSLAVGGGPLAATLGSRPFVVLGESSYALYLLHYPLWQWLAHLQGYANWQNGDFGIAYFLLYAGVAVLLSIGVYRFIEAPARVWIRQVATTRPRAHSHPPMLLSPPPSSPAD